MDCTAAFLSIAESLSDNDGSLEIGFAPKCPSPFLFQANRLVATLDSFNTFIQHVYEAYAGYHGHLSCQLASEYVELTRHAPHYISPSKGSTLTHLVHKPFLSEDERESVDQEIADFVSKNAALLRSLGDIVDDMHANGAESCNNGNDKYYRQIVPFLMDRFMALINFTDAMKKNKKKMTRSPYRVQRDAGVYSENYMGDVAVATSIKETAKERLEAAVGIDSNKAAASVTRVLQPRFAERYEDEVAPEKIMRQYRSIAEKHRKLLLEEAKGLKEQFSQELREAHQLESTVQDISGMLHNFNRLVESQSETVDSMGQATKQAVSFVSGTEAQLALTLQRTASHERGMVALILLLTALVLLLDYITP